MGVTLLIRLDLRATPDHRLLEIGIDRLRPDL
jgi:hypothetical protein